MSRKGTESRLGLRLTLLIAGAASVLSVTLLVIGMPARVDAGDAPSPTPAPNTILPVSPPILPLPPSPSSVKSSHVEVLTAGFGQSRPGGPVGVAARLRNDGGPVDLVPISITVYDASGVVIAAADVTTHYLAAGETTGFAHRLTVHGTGVAARVDLQAGDGRTASDPLPGGFSLGGVTVVSDRSGFEASAVLTSAFSYDLSEVRVDAVAYDASGSIIGGGEQIKRLVPAGGSVGVLVPLDLGGPAALVELYAHLP